MIVADSSTLILLAKSEIMDLLINNTKEELNITEEVHKEVIAKRTTDAIFIDEKIKQGKLKIRKSNSKLTNKLAEDFGLVRGEAETLTYAIENKILIMTDDKKAITAAKIFDIEFVTALTIVIALYNKKIISKEKAVIFLDKLVKYGRYTKEMINRAMVDLK